VETQEPMVDRAVGRLWTGRRTTDETDYCYTVLPSTAYTTAYTSLRYFLMRDVS
jgi:hypothetical protein